MRLFCTVVLFCAKVLADEGGQSHGKAGHWKEGEALTFSVRTAACHGYFAECIDVGLYKNVGNGNDGVLKTSRNTILDNLSLHRAVEMDTLDLQPVFFFCSGQMDQTENGACKLEDGGCQRCGTDSHAKICDKEDVQYHINAGRNDQIHQRMAAVTD